MNGPKQDKRLLTVPWMKWASSSDIANRLPFATSTSDERINIRVRRMKERKLRENESEAGNCA
jgi:hypothetical protein